MYFMQCYFDNEVGILSNYFKKFVIIKLTKLSLEDCLIWSSVKPVKTDSVYSQDALRH